MSFDPKTGKLTPDSDGMVSVKDAIKAQEWATRNEPTQRIVRSRKSRSVQSREHEDAIVNNETLISEIIETTSKVAARSLLKRLMKL